MAIQLVKTMKCRLWEMHPRLGSSISEESCATLIQSMREHGQRRPVLARRGAGSDAEFEVIYGARRLFAAQVLGMDLLLDCRQVDDREALVELDVENRVRTDISPYERGISYKRWLTLGYFPSQLVMAKALGISPAQVCRLLKFADLPAVVVGAFPSSGELREEWAVALAKRCRQPTDRQRLIARARAWSSSKKQGKSAQATYEALMDGIRDRERLGRQGHDKVVRGPDGNPIFRVAFRSRSIHLVLPRDAIDPSFLDAITESLVAMFGRKRARAHTMPSEIPQELTRLTGTLTRPRDASSKPMFTS